MSSNTDTHKSLSEECEKRLKLLELNRSVYTEVEYKEEKKKILSFLSTAAPTAPANEDSLSKTVATHWAEEAQKQLYPWYTQKLLAENRQAEIAGHYAEPGHWDKLKESFLVNARNKELPALNVLIGHYLMYADDLEASRYILMYMLTNFTSQECVETHNWYVASLWDKGTLTSRGEQLAELPYPLFPAPMNELNSKLIRAQQRASSKMVGAGEDPVGEFYKKPEDNVLHGGSYIPVYDAQGTQVGVGDLAELEAQLNTFSEQVTSNMNKLTKQIQDVQKRNSNPPVYNRGYASRGGYNGYGGQGRGYGRGGYRGGFRGGNADESTDGADQPKTVAKN